MNSKYPVTQKETFTTHVVIHGLRQPKNPVIDSYSDKKNPYEI